MTNVGDVKKHMSVSLVDEWQANLGGTHKTWCGCGDHVRAMKRAGASPWAVTESRR